MKFQHHWAKSVQVVFKKMQKVSTFTISRGITQPGVVASENKAHMHI